MRHTIGAGMVAAMLAANGGCGGGESAAKASPGPCAQAVLELPGMRDLQAGPGRVRTILEALRGVRPPVEIQVDTRTAWVRYEPALTNTDALIAALAPGLYEARVTGLTGLAEGGGCTVVAWLTPRPLAKGAEGRLEVRVRPVPGSALRRVVLAPAAEPPFEVVGTLPELPDPLTSDWEGSVPVRARVEGFGGEFHISLKLSAAPAAGAASELRVTVTIPALIEKSEK